MDLERILPDLKYVLLPAKYHSGFLENYYENAYNFWKSSWSKTFEDLKFDQKLYSDSFTRQDYVGALFCGQECIAVATFCEVTLTSPIFQDDSYFKIWNKQHLFRLAHISRKALICSYFTIHPDWRKSAQGVSLKDLKMGLQTKVLKYLKTPIMIAIVRNDRGIDKLVYRFNAKTIEHNVTSPFGDKVDLIYFSNDDIGIRDEKISELTNIIWNQSINIWESNITRRAA